jgi:hypothetical protein
MSNDLVIPKGLNREVSVYAGDHFLATGQCALWPEECPNHGAMTMPRKQNWLSFARLRLVMADGTQYAIVPTREEHTAGEFAVLVFDIE